MNHQLRILFVSLLVFVASTSSAAAQQREQTDPQPDIPAIIERLRPLVEGTSAATVTARMPSPNDRGDLAAYWISPVLTQRQASADADSTNFGFSLINPNPATEITVSTRCFRVDGSEIAAFRQSVDLSPLHYTYINAPWQGHLSSFWCAISSTANFAAFGYVVDPGSNTYRPGNVFPLIAAAR